MQSNDVVEDDVYARLDTYRSEWLNGFSEVVAPLLVRYLRAENTRHKDIDGVGLLGTTDVRFPRQAQHSWMLS